MPNTKHCFHCTKMKSCNCKGLLDLFKCQPFSNVFKYLRRTARRRRRSSKRFRSVHAVFWPLISMRSDERERAAAENNNNPSLTSLTETEIETVTSVPRPLPIDHHPAPCASSYTTRESSPPPPASSSYTKVDGLTPSLNTSNIANADEVPDHSPIATSYTKAEPSRAPLTSSHTKVPEPTPRFTSSFVRMAAAQMKNTGEKKAEEDLEMQKACRSFEKYILEMLLEERKVRDLLDVEELLYCMNNLKSPAFVELVCTFYGELCLDLFSDEADDQSMHV